MNESCPTCQAALPPRKENRFYPFCCERCQLVDLGHWLDEDYRISEPGFEGFGPGPSTDS